MNKIRKVHRQLQVPKAEVFTMSRMSEMIEVNRTGFTRHVSKRIHLMSMSERIYNAVAVVELPNQEAGTTTLLDGVWIPCSDLRTGLLLR